MMTNDSAQATFQLAIEKMESTPPPSDKYLAMKCEVALHTLKIIAAYSASGNAMPGLRGRGLSEALAFADQVIQGEFNYSKMDINFKALASTFL